MPKNKVGQSPYLSLRGAPPLHPILPTRCHAGSTLTPCTQWRSQDRARPRAKRPKSLQYTGQTVIFATVKPVFHLHAPGEGQGGLGPVSATGHNHGLDWCCPYEKLWPCFARHTGHGGYGSWPRGARVVEVSEKPFTIESWIRMENGSTHSHIVLS